MQQRKVNYVNEWIYDEMAIYFLWNNEFPESDYSLNPTKFSIPYIYISP
jgi:hypothetical protein